MNGERLHENPVYGSADSYVVSVDPMKGGGAKVSYSGGEVAYIDSNGGMLLGSNNTSRTIWVEPQHVEPADPWAVLEFGVIMAWSIVLAAFLSDYCWGKR